MSGFADRLQHGHFKNELTQIYRSAGTEYQAGRYANVVRERARLFGEGGPVLLVSAPGRTEIGGNHTDHQRGRVLAAAVNLDIVGAAVRSDDGIICIQSEGFRMDTIDTREADPKPEETGRAASLIRGVCARLAQLGYRVGGMTMYTTSEVLKGSGLSSSAAFENLVGTALNHLYNGGGIDPLTLAQVGQYAENVYFGKPSGLMDQTASAVGGMVAIDFEDPARPQVEKIDFDFSKTGHRLCIVDIGGNHADLTHEYAALPGDMHKIAAYFGSEVLREVDPDAFFAEIPALRKRCGDRAVLRALHFFGDNERVLRQTEALRNGDFALFLALVGESGRSSGQYLQNVFCCSAPEDQGMTLALALAEKALCGEGAFRVHGGGFGGTIQAYLPEDRTEHFRSVLEGVFGSGSCKMLDIRAHGAVKVLAGDGSVG